MPSFVPQYTHWKLLSHFQAISARTENGRDLCQGLQRPIIEVLFQCKQNIFHYRNLCEPGTDGDYVRILKQTSAEHPVLDTKTPGS